MWPTLPDNLSSLSATALRSLAREIKDAVRAALTSPERTDASRAEAHEWAAKRREIIALAEDADAAAALEADDADAEPEPEKVLATVGAPVVETPEGEPTAASTPVVTTFGQEPVATTPAVPRRVSLDYLQATDGVVGKDAGDPFESWAELAMAAVDRAGRIRGNSAEKFTVARIKGEYAPERVLNDDLHWNMSRFEPEEITAALCAPATPYYGLACMNSTRRPVFNSLPQWQAPRMKVSTMSSPALSDITTGVGVWTADDDADAEALKDACQTITCGSATEYVMYGVYRCLTVKNMLAMSYPELVEAYLNRLAAAHARLAEQRLLNLMGAAATSLPAPLLGYGASTSIVTTVMNYIALYQETQRWEFDGLMDAWLPRWVKTALKMDLYRRRTTNGTVNKVATDAEIEALFRDAGVNVTWFLDTPTWATTIPAVGSPLNLLPQQIDMLIAPRGKFGVMDRGELSIGVTGNGIYRDNDSNRANQFTFFFENFEGIVDTQNCGAHVLHLPVCITGIQVDDQLVNCLGQDEAGYQS